MKRLVVSILGLAVIAIFSAVLADTPATQPVMEGSHFLHANHKAPLAKIGIDVDNPGQCQKCHSMDDKGQVLAPAAQGHTPCLQSGCHGSDFLLISEKNKKDKPKDFLKASAFCLGCHPTVPWAWKKPATLVLSAWRNQREHHVEMPHFRHTQLTKKDGKQIACRDCHAVNDKFELAIGTPGHAQCAQCHNPKDYPEHTMNQCGACHQQGSRDNFLKAVLQDHNVKIDPNKGIDGSRPASDVRECASQGKVDFDKKKGRKTPCFRHETPGHRMTNDKQDVQCSRCHFVVSDKKRWGSKSFETIADLHAFKIIGNSDQLEEKSACGGKNDSQHAACSGGGVCHRHAKEVDQRCPESNCMLCHANATSKNEAF